MKAGGRSLSVVLTVLIAATFSASAPATSGDPIFGSTSVVDLSIHAPFARLSRGTANATQVAGWIELNDGKPIPAEVSRYGLSRLEICTEPPLKIDIDEEDSRGTPFEGIHSVRLVPPCRTLSYYDRYILLEYLVYRSWATVGDPAVRVRLASCRFQDSEKPAQFEIGLAFLMEDIGEAAARYGLRWLDIRGDQTLADLDPYQCALMSLFQYMIGNTDWSAVASAPGERCCHNMAVLGTDGDAHDVLLPFDFDQTGLVNAPYAAPSYELSIREVTQRIYRGFCIYNAEVPAAVAVFNEHRRELEELFSDDGLPDPKTRKRALKYIEVFYDIINDPRKLEKKILNACR